MMAVLNYIKFAFLYTVTAVLLFIFRCLERFLPSVYYGMIGKIHDNGPTKVQRTIPREDFVSSFKDCKGFEIVFKGLCQYALYGGEQAAVNQPAPNPPVIELDGVTQKSLLDFAKPLRPLVVNFGSCT